MQPLLRLVGLVHVARLVKERQRRVHSLLDALTSDRTRLQLLLQRAQLAREHVVAVVLHGECVLRLPRAVLERDVALQHLARLVVLAQRPVGRVDARVVRHDGGRRGFGVRRVQPRWRRRQSSRSVHRVHVLTKALLGHQRRDVADEVRGVAVQLVELRHDAQQQARHEVARHVHAAQALRAEPRRGDAPQLADVGAVRVVVLGPPQRVQLAPLRALARVAHQHDARRRLVRELAQDHLDDLVVRLRARPGVLARLL
mmetsp:Transcript_14865/g.51784  ORF Transcript_14865/g.51784 Transcript_14865/m.51784 type:complete len:257 (+) Transcript_14865:710-1480(+)